MHRGGLAHKSFLIFGLLERSDYIADSQKKSDIGIEGQKTDLAVRLGRTAPLQICSARESLDADTTSVSVFPQTDPLPVRIRY